MPASLSGTALAAQSAPTSDDIIVTADPSERQQIDRQVYTVKNNAQVQAESGLDVLRRVPSVTVNSENQLQLLGDVNVKVLIDGHSTADGSKTLKSLPAAQIAKIEVMTNPSASFSAEGTAGVINIITRSDPPSGLAGAATLTGDSFGGSIMKLAPSFATGSWSGSLSLDLERERYHSDRTQARTALDPASAFVLRAHDALNDSGFTGHGELAYAPRGNRKWTLTIDHADSSGLSPTRQLAYSRGSDLIPLTEFRRSLESDYNDMAALATSWSGKRQGESLNLSATYSDEHSREDKAVADDFGGAYQALLITRGHTDRSGELKLDYGHPFGRADILSLGGSLLRLHQVRLDALAVSGDHITSLPFGPDRIVGTWTTAAAYVTLQFPLGKWSLLPGLRIEDRHTDADVLGQYGHRDDLFPSPSFHADRHLTKRLDFGISYSRRVEWPSLRQLDPVIRYTDPLNGYSGNPALRPQLTNSFEASLTYTPGRQHISLKLYDRDTADAWLLRAQLLPNGVSVGSTDNIGSLRKLGGELAVQGPIWKGWHYGFNADLNARRSDLFDGGMSRAEQYFAYSGNAQIEYQDKADGKPGANHLQLSVDYYGPLHAFQQNNSGWALGSANWTHSFTARLSSVLKVSNVFASDAYTSRIFASDYSEVTRRLDDGRLVTASLICRLGKLR